MLFEINFGRKKKQVYDKRIPKNYYNSTLALSFIPSILPPASS